MKITIDKTNDGVSLNISAKNVNSHFNGLTIDNLKQLKKQIDRVLSEMEVPMTLVWNPRSKRHEIIKENF